MSTSSDVPATQGTAVSRRSGPKKKPGYKVSFAKQIGFPRQLTIRHKYVQSFTLTGTTGSYATQFFRCNGMFDPDHTGTGHQPMYYDTAKAIYRHFCVTKSNIKVTAAFGAGTAASIVGVYINDDTTATSATAFAAAEQSSGKVKYIALSSPSGPQQVMRSYWDGVKTFGPSLLANDNMQGSGSADPVEQSLWTVFIQAADSSSTVTATFLAEIEYTAVWKEIIDQAEQ